MLVLNESIFLIICNEFVKDAPEKKNECFKYFINYCSVL